MQLPYLELEVGGSEGTKTPNRVWVGGAPAVDSVATRGGAPPGKLRMTRLLWLSLVPLPTLLTLLGKAQYVRAASTDTNSSGCMSLTHPEKSTTLQKMTATIIILMNLRPAQE